MKKKVLYKLPRNLVDEKSKKIVRKIKFEKIVVSEEKDFHSKDGTIKKETLNSNGKFNVGKENYVSHDATDIDFYKQIKRKAQIITLKDIGPIIAYTGLNKNSVVMDAGVGSGSISCFLGKIVKIVEAFDVNEENIAVSKENVELLELNNVIIEKKDVYDSKLFKEAYYDTFVLDVPEPVRALNTAYRVLKVGGFLVVYAPNINQIHETVNALPENMLLEKTIEIIEREWSVKEKVLRPVTKDFGHTAFLCFIRKIY